MKWEKVKLGDIATFSNGVNFDKSNYGLGVKLVNVSDFGNRLYPLYENLQEIDCKAVRDKDYLKEGDIIFVRSNGNKALVGRCMLINNSYYPITFSGFCIRARVDDTRCCNPLFLTYHLKGNQFRKSISGTAVGANIQNLSQGRLSGYEFLLPPISIQTRIAEILSRYDDLIENYQHQISLLEEAAQRLYKEWFVDLHFPGYENTPIVDGVPEGWERKRLVDIVDVQYGYAFNGSLFNAEKRGLPILRIRNIPNGYSEDYTTEEADSNYIIHDGEIVVGMDGEFHINMWGGGPAYLVQRSCCMRPHKDFLKGFIFEAIFKPIKFFEKTLVGATVAHLGKKHIDTIEILIPSEEDFYKPFNEMYHRRLILFKQIRFLTEARDRLLPKLMNGEIEV